MILSAECVSSKGEERSRSILRRQRERNISGSDPPQKSREATTQPKARTNSPTTIEHNTPYTLIRTVSIFHLSAAYFFLASPRKLVDQNVVFMLGESMRLVR
jgi:hypothetical protein